ncbi:MAG TPA: hypothetical protein VE594_07840 [Nitrososphaeraceae archaeon]|nr:hypothetical protein [Nitrososphaeraceae archaeon]
MIKALYYSIPVLALLIMLGTTVNRSVYGHTFSGDESASFLTKVEMIKIESKLALDQVSSNPELAKEHAKNAVNQLTSNDTKEISERNSRLATELNNALNNFSNAFESGSPSQTEISDKVTSINDILADVVNSRIDQEQQENATMKALVVNDLVGETLEHYGMALGMEEGEHESQHDPNTTSTEHSAQTVSNETSSIVDEADYQTAQAIITQAIKDFDGIKKGSDTNSTELGNSLNAVKEKIDNKAPFDEIDTIVDEKITSLLNSVYDLNLPEEGGGEHADGADHAEGAEDHTESENNS